jgi:cytochrome c biogenesis protein CcdA
MGRLRDRPTIDLVIMVFTGTIASVVFLMAVGITFAGTFTPNTEQSERYLQILLSIVSTLLGALLGLLAGRSSSRPPEEKERDD